MKFSLNFYRSYTKRQ